MSRSAWALSLLCVWTSFSAPALAEAPSNAPVPVLDINPTNPAVPTAGGKQFWADELVFRGWRIQRNVYTTHCRLLDPGDRRHAWGTFSYCRATFDQIKKDRKLPPLDGKVVIVLHGLARSRSAELGMAEYLESKGNFTALTVGYPSMASTIEDNARSLAKVIENLEGAEEIDFVAHSLGNLVIRRYLAQQTDPDRERAPDRRIKRIVMVGPPNHKVEAAEYFGGSCLINLATSDVVHDLGPGWSELEPKLATPREFGVIAGGCGLSCGYNPLLTGDNDLVVRVAETKLVGATDFLMLPVRHPLMMDYEQVQAATLNFLNHGFFVAADQAHPIKDEPQETEMATAQ